MKKFSFNSTGEAILESTYISLDQLMESTDYVEIARKIAIGIGSFIISICSFWCFDWREGECLLSQFHIFNHEN